MHSKKMLLSIFVVLLSSPCFNSCTALDCALNNNDQYKVAYTIFVDQSGNRKFTKIQEAINSIPDGNNQWIRIQISAGKYVEKVTIPHKKTCIFLHGAGITSTTIEWGDHTETNTSYTFATFAENTVAKGITFKNTYNVPSPKEANGRVTQAVAALINSDKSALFQCGFHGLQDTLWDGIGRHYFHHCYIQGAVDFIFGAGQSIYEKCQINVDVGQSGQKIYPGYITAQRRESDSEPGGFVFKYCNFVATVKAYLGRPWRPYARVILYRSFLSDIIFPEGWSAGIYPGQIELSTFVEYNCSGPGADTSKRVPWTKKFSGVALSKFLRLSYINQDGWLNKLPKF